MECKKMNIESIMCNANYKTDIKLQRNQKCVIVSKLHLGTYKKELLSDVTALSLVYPLWNKGTNHNYSINFNINTNKYKLIANVIMGIELHAPLLENKATIINKFKEMYNKMYIRIYGI